MITPKYIRNHPDEVYALWKDAFLDAIFEKGPGPVHVQLAELEEGREDHPDQSRPDDL